MNVLYLINYAGKGGTEKYIKILVEEMTVRGNQCYLVYHQTGRLVDEMKQMDIETIPLTMKSPFDFRAAKSLASICKEKHIDIIHTQFARENYIAIHSQRFGHNAKVIHTAHINLKNNIVWQICNAIWMRKNAHVIAVCSSVKQHLVHNRYPRKKISVIPNGVIYKGVKKGETGIYEEFSMPKDTFLFITLTRFSAEKGIFFLLDGIKDLKARFENFKVFFAGDGEFLEEAKAYADKLGISDYVIFAGFRTDTDNILAAGKCFMNTSQSEASSFAILEAMSAGLPIIATNVGGNPDLVNEGVGILVDYNNVQSLSKAMEKMIHDSAFLASCSLNALNAVQDTFNIKTVLDKTDAIYKNALVSASNKIT